MFTLVCLTETSVAEWAVKIVSVYVYNWGYWEQFLILSMNFIMK